MHLTYSVAAAAIAAGVTLSVLTSGAGVVHATASQPLAPAAAVHLDPAGPPPGIPAEKCWRYGRSGGGSPRGGGGMPGYLPQCPVAPAPPPPPG